MKDYMETDMKTGKLLQGKFNVDSTPNHEELREWLIWTPKLGSFYNLGWPSSCEAGPNTLFTESEALAHALSLRIAQPLEPIYLLRLTSKLVEQQAYTFELVQG